MHRNYFTLVLLLLNVQNTFTVGSLGISRAVSVDSLGTLEQSEARKEFIIYQRERKKKQKEKLALLAALCAKQESSSSGESSACQPAELGEENAPYEELQEEEFLKQAAALTIVSSGKSSNKEPVLYYDTPCGNSAVSLLYFPGLNNRVQEFCPSLSLTPICYDFP